MMQSGLSRELFECWCTDKRNGVIIAGYCVEGTLAKVREYREKSMKYISVDDFIRTGRNHDDEWAKTSIEMLRGLYILFCTYGLQSNH